MAVSAVIPINANATEAARRLVRSTLNVDSVAIPRTGLELPSAMPFERWLKIGSLLSSIHTTSAWCLGDWLVYGENSYADRYLDALEQVSLRYQTLRNYAWVARRYPIYRRNEILSFGHHAEVASRPDAEQDYWLRKAQELGWSRNRLRSELRASLQDRAPTLENSTPEYCDNRPADDSADDVDLKAAQSHGIDLKFHLTLTRSQLARWQTAAKRAQMDVEQWAVCRLDDAAKHGCGQSLQRPDGLHQSPGQRLGWPAASGQEMAAR